MAGIAVEDIECDSDGAHTFEARWPPEGDPFIEGPLEHSQEARAELNQPLSLLSG